MLKVYLASVGDRDAAFYLPQFQLLHSWNKTGSYQLVEQADLADIILMTDLVVEGDQWWKMTALRNHPWCKEGRKNLFIYSELDTPWCVYQGLYCSMPKFGFNQRRQRAVSYAGFRNNQVLEASRNPQEVQPKLLFNFMGAANTSVRREVLALHHPRAVIKDTSFFNFYQPGRSSTTQANSFMGDYVTTMLNSKFVLCPAGLGTSSVRLFETMALGRVPVIISDQWVAPHGPDWSQCSLRVSERNVRQLPLLIEQAESRWETMAQQARKEWEQWFAPDVLFHRMMEACQNIARTNRLPERLWRKLPEPQLLKYRITGRLNDCLRSLQRFRKAPNSTPTASNVPS